VGPTTLLAAEVIFVGGRDFSSDRVIMLQEQDGPRQLPLEGVDATTGEVVQRLLDNEQPLTTTTHDLLARLVTALDARVHQVAIRRIAEALFGEITLDHHGQRRNVQARPGDAVALGLLAGAAIRVEAAVMHTDGFNPNDRQEQRSRERQEIETLRRRLAERTAPPPRSPIAPPPPLDPYVRQQIQQCLDRLLTNLRGWLALLTHDSGILVAWAGPGDPETMQRYCQARADHDADLTHLLMRDVYPPDQVDAVVWHSVGRLWRVEIGIADQDPAQQREQFIQVTDQAVRELESFLHPPG
jgi:bifunctional DNase/RNase